MDLTKYTGVWGVYIIQSPDRTLYVGMTNDINHRIRQHNRELAGGPHSTAPANKHPVKLVYFQVCNDRSHALRVEALIKAQQRLTRVNTVRHSGQPFAANFEEGPIIRKKKK